MTWELEDETLTECPHTVYNLRIPKKIDDEIYRVYRYGLSKNIEISVYGIIEDHVLVEILIPDQVNTATFVGLQDTTPLKYNCIIHSHPNGMKVFSKPDKDTLFTNRDFCLLICSGEYTDSHARIDTPCGCKISGKINVIDDFEDLENLITVDVAPLKNTVTIVRPKHAQAKYDRENKKKAQSTFEAGEQALTDFMIENEIDLTDEGAVSQALLDFYDTYE